MTTYPRPDATTRVPLTEPRGRILDAAAEAFMARGYDATSIDEIADRIGATKGAVYYSFRSKMDIFVAVYEQGMLRLEEQTGVAVEGLASRPAAERLRAVSVAHAMNIMRHYAYHVVIQNGVEQRRQMALKDADRERLAALDRMRAAHEALVHGLIEQCREDGSMRDVDPRLATRTLIGGVVGIARWYRPRPGQTEDEWRMIGEQVVDMLMSGLLSST